MFAFKSSREREKLPFVVSGDSLWITLHPDERTVPTAKDVDAGSELQQRWLNQAITNFSAAQRVSDCGLAARQTIFAKNFLRAHKVSSPRWRRDGGGGGRHPWATDLYSLVLSELAWAGIAGRVLRIVWDYVFVLGHTSSVQTVLQTGKC